MWRSPYAFPSKRQLASGIAGVLRDERCGGSTCCSGRSRGTDAWRQHFVVTVYSAAGIRHSSARRSDEPQSRQLDNVRNARVR